MQIVPNNQGVMFFAHVPEQNDMRLPPPNVLEELYSRSFVPRNCIPQEDSGAPHYGEETLDMAGRVLEWREPLTGSVDSYEYMGFSLDHFSHNGVDINEHTGWMAEVHTRDGINWRMVRVVHSQPYGPENRAELLRLHSHQMLERHNVRLDVVEDPHLSWYSPGNSTLCIMKHIAPMPFETFRRTFRYWLILHLHKPNSTRRGWEFYDGFLPTALTPPDPIFFDIVHGCDETSVSIGPSDNGASVYGLPTVSEWIESSTFLFLWNAYRFWTSWRPLLRVLVFIARLRARRADRQAHEPPYGTAFLAAQLAWSDMQA